MSYLELVVSGGQSISKRRHVRGCGLVNLYPSDVAYDIASGPYVGGALAIEHENVLKAFSMHADIFGRGHTVSETGGPVWVRPSFGGAQLLELIVLSSTECLDLRFSSLRRHSCC